MDEAWYGEVGHHQPIELVSDEIRGLAAQDDLGAAQVGLELVQRGFDFPSLVIEGGQFVGRGLVVIQNGGQQPIDRLGIGAPLHAARDGNPPHPPPLPPPTTPRTDGTPRHRTPPTPPPPSPPP